MHSPLFSNHMALYINHEYLNDLEWFVCRVWNAAWSRLVWRSLRRMIKLCSCSTTSMSRAINCRRLKNRYRKTSHNPYTVQIYFKLIVGGGFFSSHIVQLPYISKWWSSLICSYWWMCLGSEVKWRWCMPVFIKLVVWTHQVVHVLALFQLSTHLYHYKTLNVCRYFMSYDNAKMRTVCWGQGLTVH